MVYGNCATSSHRLASESASSLGGAISSFVGNDSLSADFDLSLDSESEDDDEDDDDDESEDRVLKPSSPNGSRSPFRNSLMYFSTSLPVAGMLGVAHGSSMICDIISEEISITSHVRVWAVGSGSPSMFCGHATDMMSPPMLCTRKACVSVN